MMANVRTLSEEQAQQFIDKGYIRLKNCFSRDVAESWTRSSF